MGRNKNRALLFCCVAVQSSKAISRHSMRDVPRRLCHKPLKGARFQIETLLVPGHKLTVGPECYRKEKKARAEMLARHTPEQIDALRAKVAAHRAAQAHRETPVRHSQLGNPTDKAWLAGWDAGVVGRSAGDNPYRRLIQAHAWERGRIAALRSNNGRVGQI